VTNGFQKRLVVEGVGFRSVVAGDKLTMTLGYSHPAVYTIPKDIKITLDGKAQNILVIEGNDKQRVGEAAGPAWRVLLVLRRRGREPAQVPHRDAQQIPSRQGKPEDVRRAGQLRSQNGARHGDSAHHAGGVAKYSYQWTVVTDQLLKRNQSKRALSKCIEGGFFLRKKPLHGSAFGVQLL